MKIATVLALIEAIDFALSTAGKLRPLLESAIGQLSDAERQQLYADHDASIQRLDEKAKALGIDTPN